MAASIPYRFFMDNFVALGPYALVGAGIGGSLGYLVSFAGGTISPAVFACAASMFFMNSALIETISRLFRSLCPRLARFISDIAVIPPFFFALYLFTNERVLSPVAYLVMGIAVVILLIDQVLTNL